MKTRPFIEISAVLALAAIAAALTTCATPAHAQPIKSTDSIGKTVWTAGDAREYSVCTVAKSTVRIGVLKFSEAQTASSLTDAVFLCLQCDKSVMTGRVEASKDALVTLSQYANSMRPVTYGLASLVIGLSTLSTETNHV